MEWGSGVDKTRPGGFCLRSAQVKEIWLAASDSETHGSRSHLEF